MGILGAHMSPGAYSCAGGFLQASYGIRLILNRMNGATLCDSLNTLTGTRIGSCCSAARMHVSAALDPAGSPQGKAVTRCSHRIRDRAAPFWSVVIFGGPLHWRVLTQPCWAPSCLRFAAQPEPSGTCDGRQTAMRCYGNSASRLRNSDFTASASTVMQT